MIEELIQSNNDMKSQYYDKAKRIGEDISNINKRLDRHSKQIDKLENRGK